MTAPTVTITIDRSSLSLSDLTFVGSGSSGYGLVSYQPPLMVARNTYAPSSRFTDGGELVGGAWEKTNIAFDWYALAASTETAVQAAFAAVVAAIGQFSFEVTTQVSGAPAQVWQADRGSMSPSQRTYVDLANHCPVYAVTIPVQPIPGS